MSNDKDNSDSNWRPDYKYIIKETCKSVWWFTKELATLVAITTVVTLTVDITSDVGYKLGLMESTPVRVVNTNSIPVQVIRPDVEITL